MQAGEYSSGITIESRKKWRLGLYCKKKARYWDVATNLRRWNNICEYVHLAFATKINFCLVLVLKPIQKMEHKNNVKNLQKNNMVK